MKKWKKNLLIIVALLALLMMVMLFTNLYLIFLPPLEAGADVDGTYGDVILVLGGGLKKGRQIGFSTEERLRLAAQLYKEKQRIILISGGSLYRGSPAIKKITDFLVLLGVKLADIRFEGKSQTTFDNFAYTRKMINDMNAKEIIVCTSPYHQERAQMMLEYLKFGNFKIVRMTQSEIYQADSLTQRLRNMKLIFREYMAIIKFKVFKK